MLGEFTHVFPSLVTMSPASCLPLIPNSFEGSKIWLREIRGVEEER